ncbi:rhomboid family intramembrane serine protease [uncultured Winogradskyella sp.]|uniref:rhomboid family intramembrane serine protease n=1 Tax=uncultured Winogradskyella sp. TaxID=395353 RepID=UPI00263323B2|nr:rhomboid family intramembrane serine protease [uncultured Winogradskyella sp.]
MSFFQDFKYRYTKLNAFQKIIALNITIFIIGRLSSGFSGISPVINFLKLPSQFADFIYKPWTLLTYGFAHFDVFHILFNLLILFSISRILLNLFRPKMALNIYMLGIIVGGLAFLLVYNVVPSSLLVNTSGVIGASAGVNALIIFLGTYMPNKEVSILRFNIKLKYIAIALVIIDILGLFGWNQGGNVAHLGGALLGYLYATKLKEGKDIGTGFERIMDTVMGWFKPSSNLKTVHRSTNKKSYAGKTKDEFNTFNDQKKVDLILDKISKSGYESLTAEEKQFLFKAGKK